MKNSDRLARLMSVPNPAAEALIRKYLPLARREARWYGNRYPHHDVEPLMMQALYLAAYDFQPERCSFFHRFQTKLRGQLSRVTRQTRRVEQLQHENEVIDPECESALDILIRAEAVSGLPAVLGALTDLEVLVIRRRYGLDGKDPAESNAIAAECGYSRWGVRTVELRALKKLRAALQED